MRLLIAFVAAVALTMQVHAQQVTGGPITLAFTFYQPLKSRSQFCEEVPELGPTIIVIDSMQDELRDMMMELRVMKIVKADVDAVENGQIVEAYLPPATFKSGTIQCEHNFLERGNYVALVRATGQNGSKEYNATFAFSVGETSKREWIATSFLTVCALGGFWLWFRRKSSGQRHDNVERTGGCGPSSGLE